LEKNKHDSNFDPELFGLKLILETSAPDTLQMRGQKKIDFPLLFISCALWVMTAFQSRFPWHSCGS
jgi:hypothetical protein